MKKLIIVFAVLIVVCLSSFAGASASEKKMNAKLSETIAPDPANSIRITIDGVEYLVIMDSNGSPIEIVRVPIRE